ncbi:MAG: glutamate--tRNA ligase family protein [Verrucomicrobiota bacterium]|nr:glutamate--tRNA ligase family protein [Verrucomicrobiota bacterium]
MTAEPRTDVRVRFGRLPSGVIHVGAAHTALFNWLFARKNGGSFIIRIEDEPEERRDPAAAQSILDSLEWLGLNWDAVYHQSQRRHIYDAYLHRLMESGRSYVAPDGTVRFRLSRQHHTLADQVFGTIHFPASAEPDITIRRQNGTYLFSFMHVVDDIEMGISHVIRGADHLSSTWKHIDLCCGLGGAPPQYAHIPLIERQQGKRITRQDTAFSVARFHESGYLPTTLFHYLCSLGWTNRERSYQVNRFDIANEFAFQNVKRANVKFDMVRCLALNRRFLQEIPLRELRLLALPLLIEAGISAELLHADDFAWETVRNRCALLSEIPQVLAFTQSSAAPLSASIPKQIVTALNEELSFLERMEWKRTNIERVMASIAARSGFSNVSFFEVMRGALFNQTHLPFCLALSLLQRDVALMRIRVLTEAGSGRAGGKAQVQIL